MESEGSNSDYGKSIVRIEYVGDGDDDGESEEIDTSEDSELLCEIFDLISGSLVTFLDSKEEVRVDSEPDNNDCESDPTVIGMVLVVGIITEFTESDDDDVNDDDEDGEGNIDFEVFEFSVVDGPAPGDEEEENSDHTFSGTSEDL